MSHSIPTICVSRASARSLNEAFSNLTTSVSEYDQFLEQAMFYGSGCLNEVLPSIRRFRCDPDHYGALLIKGLPVDRSLPPSPISLPVPLDYKRTFVSEAVISVLSSFLGDVVSFQEEQAGVPVRTISPTQRVSELDGASFGAHKLKLHTEVAWSEFRPDFVLLLCLREQPERSAKTIVSDIRDTLPLLSPKQLNQLRSSNFILGITEGFRDLAEENEYWTPPIPLISGPLHSPQIRVNFNYVRCFKTDLLSSLESFANYLEAQAKTVSLKKGDLLVIDNRKAVHGRNQFTPLLDGNDRWLQQSYVCRDPWSARDVMSHQRNHYTISASKIISNYK